MILGCDAPHYVVDLSQGLIIGFNKENRENHIVR